MSKFTIKWADLGDRVLLERIHAVMRSSYGLEAERLGLRDFPPLRRGVESLVADGNRFLCAVGRDADCDELLGVLELEEDPGADEATIASLVVEIGHLRQGIASELVLRARAETYPADLTVSCARANRPAASLYLDLGFREEGTFTLEGIELMRLRWRRQSKGFSG